MRSMDAKGRRNLVQRVASALVLLPAAAWLAWLGGWPFALLVAVAAGVCAAELLGMWGPLAGAERLGVAVAALVPLLASVARPGELLPPGAGPVLAVATVALLSLLLLRHADMAAVPARAGRIALAWLYVGLLPASVVALRRDVGAAGVAMLFAVTFANDTAAYFAGHLLGRHRLYPSVSPNKTWEGFAGGAAGSVAGALAVRAWLLPGLGLGAALVIGVGGAFLGPLGDLSESLLKRAAGVKDSSRLIPGHGGLLDRIDALLFVAPWIYVVVIALAVR